MGLPLNSSVIASLLLCICAVILTCPVTYKCLGRFPHDCFLRGVGTYFKVQQLSPIWETEYPPLEENNCFKCAMCSLILCCALAALSKEVFKECVDSMEQSALKNVSNGLNANI